MTDKKNVIESIKLDSFGRVEINSTELIKQINGAQSSLDLIEDTTLNNYDCSNTGC